MAKKRERKKGEERGYLITPDEEMPDAPVQQITEKEREPKRKEEAIEQEGQ